MCLQNSHFMQYRRCEEIKTINHLIKKMKAVKQLYNKKEIQSHHHCRHPYHHNHHHCHHHRHRYQVVPGWAHSARLGTLYQAGRVVPDWARCTRLGALCQPGRFVPAPSGAWAHRCAGAQARGGVHRCRWGHAHKHAHVHKRAPLHILIPTPATAPTLLHLLNTHAPAPKRPP